MELRERHSLLDSLRPISIVLSWYRSSDHCRSQNSNAAKQLTVLSP
jgi:hypothetical protein